MPGFLVPISTNSLRSVSLRSFNSLFSRLSVITVRWSSSIIFFFRFRDSRAEMRFCSRRSRRLPPLVASSSLSELSVPSVFSSLDVMVEGWKRLIFGRMGEPKLLFLSYHGFCIRGCTGRPWQNMSLRFPDPNIFPTPKGLTYERTKDRFNPQNQDNTPQKLMSSVHHEQLTMGRWEDYDGE